MTRQRAGVIGVGHLGQHHARHYATLPGSTLVGVYDADKARADLIAERHATRAYRNLNELLRDVDVVSVAAPTSAHYAAAKACLEAGKHVLVEKPIAVTAAEARELVELARARRLVLQVGHSERFNPIMLQMRPAIERPVFIECHRLSPYGERGTDVDVVLDLMIHDLDLVLSFQPGAVEDVQAAGVSVLSPRVDIANARITFASGCVANVTASRVSTNKMRRLRLFQRDRYIAIDFQTRQAAVSRRTTTDGGARPTIDLETHQAGDEEPLRLELASFLQAAATGARPVVSGEDGAAALELALRVTAAIERFTQRHEAAPPPVS